MSTCFLRIFVVLTVCLTVLLWLRRTRACGACAWRPTATAKSTKSTRQRCETVLSAVALFISCLCPCFVSLPHCVVFTHCGCRSLWLVGEVCALVANWRMPELVGEWLARFRRRCRSRVGRSRCPSRLRNRARLRPPPTLRCDTRSASSIGVFHPVDFGQVLHLKRLGSFTHAL